MWLVVNPHNGFFPWIVVLELGVFVIWVESIAPKSNELYRIIGWLTKPKVVIEDNNFFQS